MGCYFIKIVTNYVDLHSFLNDPLIFISFLLLVIQLFFIYLGTSFNGIFQALYRILPTFIVLNDPI